MFKVYYGIFIIYHQMHLYNVDILIMNCNIHHGYNAILHGKFDNICKHGITGENKMMIRFSEAVVCDKKKYRL
jgi:hypothetical protein